MVKIIEVEPGQPRRRTMVKALGAFVTWGGPLFGPRRDDDLDDDVEIGGYLIRRTPSGELAATTRKERPE